MPKYGSDINNWKNMPAYKILRFVHKNLRALIPDWAAAHREMIPSKCVESHTRNGICEQEIYAFL